MPKLQAKIVGHTERRSDRCSCGRPYWWGTHQHCEQEQPPCQPEKTISMTSNVKTTGKTVTRGILSLNPYKQTRRK